MRYRGAFLGERLLFDLHREGASTAGDVQQQDDADGEPDAAVGQCVEVEVRPQHPGEAHPDERQNDVVEYLPGVRRSPRRTA